jgi:hypothetical protein
MAWTGTTTYMIPILAKVVLSGIGSAIPGSTTAVTGSTLQRDAAGAGTGVTLTTGTDVVRFPYGSANGKMVLYAEYVSLGTTVATYPAIALRIPPTTDYYAWQSGGRSIGTSSEETGWKLLTSTLGVTAASSNSTVTGVFGPFDPAKYGHVMSASSNGINAGQPYLECMFNLSTVAGAPGTYQSTKTFLSSTTLEYVRCNVTAFELP